ncbi:MAG: hypothetical protein JWO05_2937 [Gemmatimonadetes bacterium]|nr:hypothetical protein [Gemmatimonadota bacterium]
MQLLSFALAVALASPLHAQAPASVSSSDTTAFYRALDLEGNGKNREAAVLFRSALHSGAAVNSLLGLERVYAALGWADSLLSPLDTLLRANPTEAVFHSVKLRTLTTLNRDAAASDAFEQWIRAVPSDPSPYREFARILLQRGKPAAADSIIERARTTLGNTRDLRYEVAQVKSASGDWEGAAVAWREALAAEPYLAQAAAFALMPTPSAARPAVRDKFLSPPPVVAARRALSELELAWGFPGEAWSALRDLLPDTAAASAWRDFAEREEAEERWSLARDAWTSVMRVENSPALALRAARASLNAGDALTALRLAPLGAAGLDSARVAESELPIMVRALAMLGRAAEAERLVGRFDKWIAADLRTSLTEMLALGWVRSGDLVRARAALKAAGVEADSSAAAGWLALYEGNLKGARVLLRHSSESTPELALALGLVARVKADSVPALGAAFVLLARGDTAGAASGFVDVAQSLPEGASVLYTTAARLRLLRRDENGAVALWKQLLEKYPDSPEGAEADLELARSLERRKDSTGARAHLEHLILTYPQSALVPQARRELELIKQAIP